MLDSVFVYHPAPWQEHDWARLTGLPLEDVWFKSSDGLKLFGWYVPPYNIVNPPVLLWCHGNAGNIIHRLQNLIWLHRLGFAVFLFDYRGYGRSEGSPCEEGLYRDALAAYAYLVDKRGFRPGRLVLFGRSLGGAVAGTVASQRQAAGLILESAFPSVEAVTRAHYGSLPVHWLLSAEYDLAKRLPSVRMPTLVIHGGRDEIIPTRLGREVYEAARDPKSFYLVPGANHNNVPFVGGRAYLQQLRQFVAQVVR